ncbi:MAG: hypothetical protein D6761_06850 [Candidatus Dadabacteria bacterium]|nr:MAG: hypothetical protein D6761_06850 [Candidatus Dadabacteria bacterium]
MRIGAAISGLVALGLAVFLMANVRNQVTAERYAIGEAMRHLEQLQRDRQVLQERWERAVTPDRLERLGRMRLGMIRSRPEQVLR